MKKIELKERASEVKRLMKAHRCTAQTISKALNFRTNTNFSQKIRVDALKHGAVLIDTDSEPIEEDTYFNTADNCMIQTFGNRIKLVVDMDENSFRLMVDGTLKEERRGLSVPDFMLYQKEIRMMAETL